MVEATSKTAVVRLRHVMLELTSVAPGRFVHRPSSDTDFVKKPNGYAASGALSHIEVWISNRKNRWTVIKVVEEPFLIPSLSESVERVLSECWTFHRGTTSECESGMKETLFAVTGAK